MVDLKGGGWYCRHQYHDMDSTKTSWTDESLKDLAYERALKTWQERPEGEQPTE